MALERGSGIGTGQFYGVPGTWINGKTVVIRKRANYYRNSNDSSKLANKVFLVRVVPETRNSYLSIGADGRPSHLWYYPIGIDLDRGVDGSGVSYQRQKWPKYQLYYYNILQSYGLAEPPKSY